MPVLFQSTCEISEWSNTFKYKCHCFETSQDLRIRCPIRYWNRALLIALNSLIQGIKNTHKDKLLRYMNEAIISSIIKFQFNCFCLLVISVCGTVVCGSATWYSAGVKRLLYDLVFLEKIDLGVRFCLEGWNKVLEKGHVTLRFCFEEWNKVLEKGHVTLSVTCPFSKTLFHSSKQNLTPRWLSTFIWDTISDGMIIGYYWWSVGSLQILIIDYENAIID